MSLFLELDWLDFVWPELFIWLTKIRHSVATWRWSVRVVSKKAQMKRPLRQVDAYPSAFSDDSDNGGGVAVAPPISHVSLEEVHGSVEVPDHQAGFWHQLRAFAGPAILVSVGYMDPGNWGTDLQGGAQIQVRTLVGRWTGKPDRHFHAGDCCAPGRRDGKRPGSVLPRLVSALDLLAQLAHERSRHRRL